MPPLLLPSHCQTTGLFFPPWESSTSPIGWETKQFALLDRGEFPGEELNGKDDVGDEDSKHNECQGRLDHEDNDHDDIGLGDDGDDNHDGDDYDQI